MAESLDRIVCIFEVKSCRRRVDGGYIIPTHRSSTSNWLYAFSPRLNGRLCWGLIHHAAGLRHCLFSRGPSGAFRSHTAGLDKRSDTDGLTRCRCTGESSAAAVALHHKRPARASLKSVYHSVYVDLCSTMSAVTDTVGRVISGSVSAVGR